MLSLALFFVAVATVFIFPKTASFFGQTGERALGHALGGVVIAANICILSVISGVISLVQKENPNVFAITGIAFSALPALAGLYMDLNM
jgi:hypothetical protein